MHRRLAWSLAAVTLIVSACGGDDDAATPSPTSTGATAVQGDASTSSAAAPAESTTTTTGNPSVDTTASPGPLTASARGVTADTINLGLATIGPEQLEQLGADGPITPSVDLVQAFVDDVNANGGVLGRQIEVTYRPFDLFQQADSEAACLELTEDNEIFAVIGTFLGDSLLCFTETHSTPYLGMWGQSADRDARSSGAPFIALEMADDRQRAAALQALIDEGYLEGRRVALYTKAADRALTNEVLVPVLEEAGIDVVVDVTLDDFGGDTAAEDAALDAIVERVRAEDVDTFLNVTDFPPPMVAFQRAGWLPEQVLSTSAQALSEGFAEGLGIEPASLAVVTVAAPYVPSVEESLADEGLLRCIEVYNATSPAVPIDTDAASYGELNTVAQYCSAVKVFAEAARAAGPDLTPESWGRGAESLGTLDLPGVPFSSLGPGKHDAGDAIGLYQYDPDAGRMVSDGPLEVG